MAVAVVAVLTGCATRNVAQPEGARAAVRSGALPSELAGSPRVRALLVSGDAEPRHQQNLRDAARALTSRGVAESDIETLSASTKTGDRPALRAAVERLARTVGEHESWVLYVTGHGAPEGIVLSDGVLPHDELIRWLAPLSSRRAVVVFDGCFTGGLPWRFVEAGFDAYAMAPVTEGHSSSCQLFAPHLWEALQRGLDTDGDGVPSFREAFRFALGVYEERLRDQHQTFSGGAWGRPIRELETLGELARGAALVQLTSKGCGPCVVQRQRLALLSSLLDDLAVYTVDVETSPLAPAVSKLDGMKPFGGAVPTLLFVSDGRVVHQRSGLTDNPTLLTEARDKLHALQAHGGMVDALLRGLASDDRERAAFSMRALVELGEVRAPVVEAFRRWVSDPRADRAAIVTFVDAVRYAKGYASLKSALGTDGRAALDTLVTAQRRAHVDEAIGDLRASDTVKRAVAFADLWRLGEAHPIDLEAMSAALTPLAELSRHGDVEQRRMATHLLGVLARRFASAPVNVAFQGVDPIEEVTLRHEAEGWSLDNLLTMGAWLLEWRYADRGNLHAAVSSPAVAHAGGTLTLTFAIRPGPRHRLRSISAVEVSSEEDDAATMDPLGGRAVLDALVRLPPGAPASRRAIAERSRAVEAHYRDAGYADASAHPSLVFHDDDTCTVTVRVVRGARRDFGELVIVGVDGAMLERVRATIGIRGGQRYHEGRIEAAKKRVSSLPHVERVDVSTKVARDGRVDLTFELAGR